jgi:predicted DNA-binding transcriptional regulator AlpA
LTTNKPWTLAGISRASWYRLLSAGKAPKPMDLLPGKNFWRTADVIKWLESVRTAR